MHKSRFADFIFFDTETYTQNLVNRDELFFKLGVMQKVVFNNLTNKFIFNNPEHSFDLAKMHEILNKNIVNDTWLIAHNWHFDFFSANMLDFLKKYEWKITFFVFEANRFILVAKRDKITLSFVDTFNYFQFSLRKMGEILGSTDSQKLQVDFDSVSNDDLLVYCRKDVFVLAKFFTSFCELCIKYNVILGYTIASCAFSTFTLQYLPCNIIKSSVELEEGLEKESYYGGRVECSRLGRFEGKFFMVDINSMYPYVMRNCKLPIEPTENKTNCYIADCTVETFKPCLPKRINGKLCFPIGKFRGIWCSAELENPEIKILEVHQIQYYKSAILFRRYVDVFYGLKKRNINALEVLFAKLMLNSCYGKYGQKDYQTIECGNTNISNGIHKTDVGTIFVLNGQMFMTQTCGYKKSSHVAVASFITSYARRLLFESILKSGFNNNYYRDTDSLILNENGYINLGDTISDKLGEWKLEDTSDKLYIRGAKLYHFGKKLKVKGVSKPTELTDSYRQERWHKTKTMLRHFLTDRVIIEKFEKNLTAQYDKGVVAEGYVYPYVLAE